MTWSINCDATDNYNFANTVFPHLGTDKGLKWDESRPEGRGGACRLEIYQTNPSEELDMATWETEISFRLAGQLRVRYTRSLGGWLPGRIRMG